MGFMRSVGRGAAAALLVGALTVGCSDSDGDLIVLQGGELNVPEDGLGIGASSLRSNDLAPDGGGVLSGGEDGTVLYVTATSALYRVRLAVSGVRPLPPGHSAEPRYPR